MDVGPVPVTKPVGGHRPPLQSRSVVTDRRHKAERGGLGRVHNRRELWQAAPRKVRDPRQQQLTGEQRAEIQELFPSQPGKAFVPACRTGRCSRPCSTASGWAAPGATCRPPSVPGTPGRAPRSRRGPECRRGGRRSGGGPAACPRARRRAGPGPRGRPGLRHRRDPGGPGRRGQGGGVPPKANRRRPPPYDRAKYRERNRIERRVGRLKQFRGVATRYDKPDTLFLGGLLAALTLVRLQC